MAKMLSYAFQRLGNSPLTAFWTTNLAANLKLAFTDGDADTRLEALTAMESFKTFGPNAEAILSASLSDTNREIRLKALQILSQNPSLCDSLLSTLLGLLNTDDKELQETLYECLAKCGAKTVANLRPLLGSEQSLVRFNAVSTLKLLVNLSEPCVQDLITLAIDSDFDIASATVTLLRQIGKPAIDALILKLAREGERLRSIQVLSALGHDAARAAGPLANLAATDPTAEVRLAAINAIAVVGFGSDATSVELCFRNSWSKCNRMEQLAIAVALKATGLKNNADHEAWVQREIREHLGDTDIAVVLIQSLDTNNECSGGLIRSLESGTLTDNLPIISTAICVAAKARPSLLDRGIISHLMQVASSDVLTAALQGIMFVSSADRVDLLDEVIRAGILTDNRIPVRLALLALMKVSPQPQFEPYVLAALSDPNSAVRATALSAVGAYWETSSIRESVRTMVTFDTVDELRQLAVKMLSTLGYRDLIEVLSEAALDRSRLVQIEAIAALAEFGYMVLPVLRHLRLKNFDNVEVYFFIQEAISRISGIEYFTAPDFEGFDSSYPRMPWPPSRFTDRMTFQKTEVGEFSTTLGNYYDRIVEALRRSDYPDPSLYAIPGGFAVAVMPERFLNDGRPFSTADRWTLGKLPLASVNIVEYIRRLLFGSKDRFRWLVFYATRLDFGSEPLEIAISQARTWDQSGFAGLPSAIAQQRASNYMCGVLTFEFFLSDGSDDIQLASAPSITASQHLLGSGLFSNILAVNPTITQK
jgi:HEAT repeat protein